MSFVNNVNLSDKNLKSQTQLETERLRSVHYQNTQTLNHGIHEASQSNNKALGDINNIVDDILQSLQESRNVLDRVLCKIIQIASQTEIRVTATTDLLTQLQGVSEDLTSFATSFKEYQNWVRNGKHDGSTGAAAGNYSISEYLKNTETGFSPNNFKNMILEFDPNYTNDPSAALAALKAKMEIDFNSVEPNSQSKIDTDLSTIISTTTTTPDSSITALLSNLNTTATGAVAPSSRVSTEHTAVTSQLQEWYSLATSTLQRTKDLLTKLLSFT